MEYGQMLGTGITPPAAPQQQQVPGGFAGMQSPEPHQFMAEISKPAQSSQEFEERLDLWSQLVQKVQTDPNLRRAMLMMGTQIAQPQAPGQTTVGHVASALGTGAAAYNAGEYEQYQQQLTGRKEERETAESAAKVRATQAGAASTEQSTAQQAEAWTTQLELLKTKLGSAKTEQEVATIKAELEKRKADIEKSIPDARLRAGRLAEIEQVEAAVAESLARTKNYKASAGFTTAKTEMENKEIKALEGMTDDQLRQYFSKSGEYGSTATSGIVQQGNFWGQVYDKLPTTDPDKKGQSREQFMKKMLKTASEKSLMETYLKMVQFLEPNDPLLQQTREMVQGQLDARKGTGRTPAAGGGNWQPGPAGWKWKMENGERVYERDTSKPAAAAPKAGAAAAPKPPAEDTTRYVREKNPRGGWTYTQSGRGITRAEWEKLDAKEKK